MVATATPRFGFEPKLCLARPMLLAALECYERGDLIGCGVRLRESVTRFLIAAVDWYGVTLPKRTKRDKHPRPAALACALHQEKQLDQWGLECILEMLQAGNALAHCGHVCPKSLRGGISILFSMIDSEPYSAMKERDGLCKPAESASNWDNDDFEDGDDWKIGGAV